MHKEPCDVKLQNIAIFAVVTGTAADEMVNAPYRIMSSLPNPTGETVIDEYLFKFGVEFVNQQVMNHPVPEVRREDLPLDRPSHYEGHKTSRLIAGRIHVLVKFLEISLIIHLKGHGIAGTALLETTRFISGIKIG